LPSTDQSRTSQVAGVPPLLLHICCAPCATYPVQTLRQRGFSLTGYWHNPNIQPWLEYESRRASLASYVERVSLPVVWEPGYDLLGFLGAVAGREGRPERCEQCYRLRLERTAACAARHAFERFSTTLLVSPYQDQALIRAAGEEAANRHGVEFYFEDFRRGWAERGRLTREYGLYRQQYCGCLYSEFERYAGRAIAEAATLSHEDR